MNRRAFIVLLGSAAIAVPSSASAEPATAATAAGMATRLVGTWRFVSSINTRGDGTTFDRWGSNPRGTFMFDAGGRFVQVIMGEESRMFGAKAFFAFGTYSVDEASKTIVTRIEGSSISKLNGATQRRVVTTLTQDELKYVNPVTGVGTQVESVWQRTTAATQ
jgi:hypothetical protein